MDSTVLIITACLSGSFCRDFPMPLDEAITPQMCLRQGQIGLAEWAARHPGYVIRRWSCEAAGTSAAL